MLFKSTSGRKPKPRALLQMIRHFEKHGHTTHSADGMLCAPLLQYCVEKHYAFNLRYYPGGGYFLEKLNKTNMSSYVEETSEAIH